MSEPTTEPTTEAGRWLEEQEPYLTTWAWGGLGTPIILAIEAEARADLVARLQEAVGEGEADVGLPHWHHASGGTSPNAWDNDRDGVFVDRAAVLAAIEEAATDAPFVHPRLGVFAPNGPNPDPLGEEAARVERVTPLSIDRAAFGLPPDEAAT